MIIGHFSFLASPSVSWDIYNCSLILISGSLCLFSCRLISVDWFCHQCLYVLFSGVTLLFMPGWLLYSLDYRPPQFLTLPHTLLVTSIIKSRLALQKRHIWFWEPHLPDQDCSIKTLQYWPFAREIQRWSANIRHMSPIIQKSFIPRSRHYHGYAIRILFDLLHNWENTPGTFDGKNHCGRYTGLLGIHTISIQTFISAVSGNCVTGEDRVCLELPSLRGGFTYAQFTVTFQEDWTLLYISPHPGHDLNATIFVLAV